jgi:predicted nucleic acid-binding protein
MMTSRRSWSAALAVTAAAPRKRFARFSVTRFEARAVPAHRSDRACPLVFDVSVSTNRSRRCAINPPNRSSSSSDSARHECDLRSHAEGGRSRRRGLARFPTAGIHLDDVDHCLRGSVWAEILATGRRRRSLEEAFGKALEEDFEGRVIPFDQAAAQSGGRIAAERRRLGRSIEIRDVQIAGIAAARKATIATRNLRHFEGLGLELIDPWSG